MELSYDGTNYHGWQRQPNGNTVQEEIEAALRKLLRQDRVVTVGCGRTDAGVHARKFYLHFNAQKEIPSIEEVFFKLNMMLPWDIGVHAIFPIHDKAHARFDATERSYEYHLHQTRDPFIHRFSNYYPWELDIEAMNEACRKMLNYNDFAAFCKSNGGQRTTICDLRRAEWIKNGDRLVFHITADRFLRNMVRAVVGTLVEVGRGKMTPDQFAEVVETGNRKKAGESFEACGLHLTQIKYPYIPLNTLVSEV